jgi:hypothetical protein
MLAFIYDGDAYIYLQYSGDGLDSAVSLDSAILEPDSNTKYYCYFKQGQNAGLVDGVQLTGQTSGAVIKAKKIITSAGAVGTSDATGVMFYDKVSGTVVSGENLRVSTTTYAVSASKQLDAPVGRKARAILLTVETNSIRFTQSGVSPTSSTGTPASFGHLILDTGSVTISGYKNVRDFKMINAVAASNAVANLTIYY